MNYNHVLVCRYFFIVMGVSFGGPKESSLKSPEKRTARSGRFVNRPYGEVKRQTCERIASPWVAEQGDVPQFGKLR